MLTSHRTTVQHQNREADIGIIPKTDNQRPGFLQILPLMHALILCGILSSMQLYLMDLRDRCHSHSLVLLQLHSGPRNSFWIFTEGAGGARCEKGSRSEVKSWSALYNGILKYAYKTLFPLIRMIKRHRWHVNAMPCGKVHTLSLSVACTLEQVAGHI